MPDNSELPPSPPTSGSGPVIDPSSTAVPAVPRPTAPALPSTTSSPWVPRFETPSAAPAGPPPAAAPVRARRAALHTRTRAIVGGSSVAAFLAILAAVGIHGRTQPAASVTAGNDGSATSFDPGFVRPNLGQGSSGNPYGGSQSGGFGSSQDDPFAQGFSGGGFSATPGTGAGSAHTRSHGS